ncbi:MAG: copper homeostasis protein CutC [Dorea sp.]|jgi:copper homeostasis protein|nr:copper homeostasis protein CutC [Dorea sp.]
MKPNLEVCVDSVESALNAQAGGADRLEVCSNLIIGGTTPGVSQFKQIRDICEIELRVLIRPRFGDFLYTDAEFQMMKEDILMFGELGADGIAVGCLKADGSMDMEQMRALRECAGPMKLTMHRAFDVCRDPYEALEEAVGLGIDTILTSGQAAVCTEGIRILERLVSKAGDQIEVMAGSGVNAGVIRQMVERTHVLSFHMSGKQMIDSGMIYRKPDINMGLSCFSEYSIIRTDKEEVKKARQALFESLKKYRTDRQDC